MKNSIFTVALVTGLTAFLMGGHGCQESAYHIGYRLHKEGKSKAECINAPLMLQARAEQEARDAGIAVTDPVRVAAAQKIIDACEQGYDDAANIGTASLK